MKKLILMLLCAFIVIACSKDKSDEEFDDPNIPVPDPIGVLTGNMARGEGIYPTGGADNHPILAHKENDVFYFYPSYWAIVSYGQVAGLGNVKKIPKTGWIGSYQTIEEMPKIQAEVGKAYVFASKTLEMYRDLTLEDSRIYVRLFIQDWIYSGEVIGLIAKHQSPFRDPSINKFEVSTTSVKLLPTDTHYKLVEITPFQTWSVKVETTGSGIGVAITDEGNLQIGKLRKDAQKGVHKVRLTSEGFSDIIINVEVI